MMVKKVTLFLLLLFCLFVFPQNKKLDDMSFGEIEKKIDSLAFSKKNAFSIINFYIKKAKKEKNQEALVYAYRYATKASDNEFDGLRFADSAIIIAKRHNNTKLLSEAFFNKGVYLMDNFRNAEALDNILIANKYSIILKDLYIQNKTLYYIAQNKILLGQEDSAISDLKKCISYFKKNLNNSNLGEDYNIYFVYSLISIIDSNSKLGYNNQDYFNQAFSYIDKTGEKNLLPYFISSKGINFYFTGDYQKAIKMLSQAIKLYNDIWPHYTEIFYIGLSYWKLGQKDKAVAFFERLDKNYNKEKNQNPEFRPAYELLIEYYKSKNNKKKQLEYINKLMALDDSYEKNYKYLFSKIDKEYDTHKLIQEKNEIQNSFKMYKYITIIIIIASILLISLIVYKYNSTRKKIRQINSNKQPVVLKENEKTIDIEHQDNNFPQNYYEKIPGLKADTVKNILKGLREFEENLGFLDYQLTQSSLSEKLETNASYLSKIIKIYKEKNYNVYIGDLRTNYIIELLNNDKKFLDKEIKELAHLGGFNNPENFADHFKRKLNTTPSQYIKNLKQERDNIA